jgi:NodT family efflux transporter outer membrane factor (OMF) lipoprotein
MNDRFRFWPWLLVLLMTIAGCAGLPKATPRAASLRSTGVALSESQSALPHMQWPSGSWWNQFGDPQLDELLRRAIADNPHIATAEARIAVAKGFAQVARSAQLPTVDAAAELDSTRFTHNSDFPEQINGHDLFGGPVWNNSLGVSVAYHVDFWGRDRAVLAAALDEVRVAEYEAQDARLAIEGALVRTYARLDYIYRLQDNERSILADEGQVADLAERRLKAGLGTEFETQQARTAVAGTEADLVQTADRIELLKHQIAALCGESPGSADRIERPALQAVNAVASLPTSISAELIGRRPDVLAERARVEATRQGIAAARADFYPNVDLKALAGFAAIGFDQFLGLKSLNTSVGPAVTLPLFEGGRLRGALHVRESQYDIAVDAYNAAILESLHEIADQVSRLQSLQELQVKREETLRLATRAHELARIAFRAGLTDYVNVLSTESQLNGARNAVAQVTFQQVDAIASLDQALGGGLSMTDTQHGSTP